MQHETEQAELMTTTRTTPPSARGILLATCSALLLLSLCACEKTDEPANMSSYERGYAIGVTLAQQLPEIKLQEAMIGICDALTEVDASLTDIGLCTEQQTDSATSAQIKIASTRPPAPARSGAFKDDYAALNAMREGVVSLPSGVQYEVLSQGNGAKPSERDAVHVNYEATLPSGAVFDTTYEDGKPLLMKLDEIALPGLREALLLMNEGAKWRVVIPPSAGFRHSGNNMLRRRDLIYEIELIGIEEPKPAAFGKA